MLVLSLFAVLGVAHYGLIGTRFDRRWVKYVFITVDIAVVSTLVATQPLPSSAPDLPPVMAFRGSVFPFYFVILGVAAFSFSPAMVMWTGIAGALGWLGAFWHTAAGSEGVRNWSEIPPNPTAEQIMAVVLDPKFGGLNGRIQEAVLLVVAAFPDCCGHVAGARHAKASTASGTHRPRSPTCSGASCRRRSWTPWSRGEGRSRRSSAKRPCFSPTSPALPE